MWTRRRDVAALLRDAQVDGDLAGGFSAIDPERDGVTLERVIKLATRFLFRLFGGFDCFHQTDFPFSLLIGVRQIEATSEYVLSRKRNAARNLYGALRGSILKDEGKPTVKWKVLQ